MKYADKIGAKFTMVLGDNELQEGKAELKNMGTRREEEDCHHRGGLYRRLRHRQHRGGVLQQDRF